jgi:serine/threonine protein phosphatase 1
VRAFDQQVGCNVICLRGNHEDAWLRVRDGGWPEFVIPPSNGCLATWKSYLGERDAPPSTDDIESLYSGSFFPDDVIEWMRSLPYWYEDEHAIYVHAGLVEREGKYLHPKDTTPMTALLWTRSKKFFAEYRGKRVVVGHTATELLPPELSSYTPEDPADMWAGESVLAIDTGCGMGGFLTIVELPSLKVYESR